MSCIVMEAVFGDGGCIVIGAAFMIQAVFMMMGCIYDGLYIYGLYCDGLYCDGLYCDGAVL